ncbi:MAG: HlyD family efflux transporter periplasmic adaptor subunit [Cetobacterium sp.]|uniref:HlyD family efflux transporter periplasmic adaptor subunit n=1 Tax=Cetobacterium sp. TaxID=2071632 RepID=UPI003F398B6E
MSKKIIKIIMLFIISFKGYDMIKNSIKEKDVKVSRIGRDDISNSLFFMGIVTQGDVVPVYVEAPALVESVIAKLGQEVDVGDKLLIFSTKSIAESDKELRINQLDIKDTKLRIADFEAGSVKLELDNRKLDIKNLEERIKGDERRLLVLTTEAKNLKDKANTYQKLLEADGVSSLEANAAKNESDKKRIELEELKINLNSNRQKLELSAASFESLTRELAIEEAKLKSNLEKLELNNQILSRRLDQLKKPLEAPIAGVITGIDVIEGSNVFSGQRLLAIAPKAESIVKIDVPLHESYSIGLNQRAIVRSSSIDGELFYEGVVSRVSNVATLTGKNDKAIEVEIKVSTENNLKPGFITDVEIQNNFIKNTSILNSFSIIEEGSRNFVYIVKDGKAHKTEVQVEAKTNKGYEILNLPVGTEVIINPFRVSNGQRVKVID